MCQTYPPIFGAIGLILSDLYTSYASAFDESKILEQTLNERE
jgi:hypothetical protein